MIRAEQLGSIASSTKDSQLFVLSQKWVDAYFSVTLCCADTKTPIFFFQVVGSGSLMEAVGFVLVLRPLSQSVLLGDPVAGFTNPPPLILKHAPRFDHANGPRSVLDTSIFWYL